MASWIGQGGVIRVFTKEVAIVISVKSTVMGGRVGRAHGKIDLNKIPTGTKGTSRAVGNEEKTVGGSSNGGVKVGTRLKRRRGGRVI